MRAVPRSRRGIRLFVHRFSLFLRHVLDGGRNFRRRMLRGAGLGLCPRHLARRAAAAGHDRHANRCRNGDGFGSSRLVEVGSTRSTEAHWMRYGGRRSLASLDRGGAYAGIGVDRVRRHGARSGRGDPRGSHDAAGGDAARSARTREWSGGGAHFVRAVGSHAAVGNMGEASGDSRRLRAKRGPALRERSLWGFAKLNKMSYHRAEESAWPNQNRT